MFILAKNLNKYWKILCLVFDKYRKLVYNIGMDKKYEDIEQRLKRAVLESEMSRYRIAKLSGISEAQLSYFIHDKRSLTLPAAAKLAKVLGLELRPIKKGRVK